MSKPSTIDTAIDAVIDAWCLNTMTDPPEPSEGFQMLRKLMKEANESEQKVCRLFVCKEDTRPLPPLPLPSKEALACLPVPTPYPQPPPPLNLSGIRSSCSYGIEGFEAHESPLPSFWNNVPEENISPGLTPLPGNENKVSDMEAVD